MFKMYLNDLFYLAIFTEVCDFGSQKRIETKANPCEKICRISIWISLHSRNVNKKTNQLQERYLIFSRKIKQACLKTY